MAATATPVEEPAVPSSGRGRLLPTHRPQRRERRAVRHYYFNAAYMADGRVLDPARPEGLL